MSLLRALPWHPVSPRRPNYLALAFFATSKLASTRACMSAGRCARFSQGCNRRRLRRGHVFQGRDKSIPVNASDSDPYYFKIMADCIHLHPARAGLAGGKNGKLIRYRWSSLPSHARANGPDWLEADRLLRALELAGDGRGRRTYVAWLEARAARDGGKVDDMAMKALRRGWHLGEATCGDRLLDMLKKPSAKKSRAGTAPRHR